MKTAIFLSALAVVAVSWMSIHALLTAIALALVMCIYTAFHLSATHEQLHRQTLASIESLRYSDDNPNNIYAILNAAPDDRLASAEMIEKIIRNQKSTDTDIAGVNKELCDLRAYLGTIMQRLEWFAAENRNDLDTIKSVNDYRNETLKTQYPSIAAISEKAKQ